MAKKLKMKKSKASVKRLKAPRRRRPAKVDNVVNTVTGSQADLTIIIEKLEGIERIEAGIKALLERVDPGILARIFGAR